MMRTRYRRGAEPHGGAVRLSRLLLITALMAGLGGCDRLDDLLRVDVPSRIPASALEVPGNAQLMVNGVVADFECAFGAYIVLGGLIGDELIEATQTADRMPYDRRTFQPGDFRYAQDTCERLGVYRTLQAARAGADNALGLLRGWTDEQVPNRVSMIATAATYSGYSLVLLGEGFCSMVISDLDANRQPAYGVEISRDEVFQIAISRFDDAITAATASGNTQMLHTSRLGRARALLNLRRFDEAAADAALVPGDFVMNVTASATTDRRTNRVWAQNSPDATEGRNVSVGEPYRTMDDDRVPVVSSGLVSITNVEIWFQQKYPQPGSELPLATWREAQLIIAEAHARAGGARLADAIEIIDEFRARGGQDPFAGATQEEIMAEIVEQRRRELFLESHHLGDFIRFELPLNPPPGEAYHGGGFYGGERCLPLPNVERQNNPNV